MRHHSRRVCSILTVVLFMEDVDGLDFFSCPFQIIPGEKGEINHLRMSSYLWNGGCSLCCFTIASSMLGIHVLPPHCPSFRHVWGSPTATSIPKHLYMATARCTIYPWPSVLPHCSLLYHRILIPSPPQLLRVLCLPHCLLRSMNLTLVFPPDILLFNLQAKPCFPGHLAPAS